MKKGILFVLIMGVGMSLNALPLVLSGFSESIALPGGAIGGSLHPGGAVGTEITLYQGEFIEWQVPLEAAGYYHQWYNTGALLRGGIIFRHKPLGPFFYELGLTAGVEASFLDVGYYQFSNGAWSAGTSFYVYPEVLLLAGIGLDFTEEIGTAFFLRYEMGGDLLYPLYSLGVLPRTFLRAGVRIDLDENKEVGR